jgi:DNA-binding IclR family transcriptional regulator
MPASIGESDRKSGENAAGPGSQTLMRGLDLIEAIATRTMTLSELSEYLGLNKSTVHRLASGLVDRGFLGYLPRQGYRLGAKLLELGYIAQTQIDLVQFSRDHMEKLAAKTEDTVHLGVLEDNQALYLDKIAGRRRINISSRVGDRQPVTSTGLGKALMLDHPASYWEARLAAEQPTADASRWLLLMTSYARAGCAYDLEENEDQIRCVAAPVRDASGRIVGAISVSSAGQYMSDERMGLLSVDVRAAAAAISKELGWTAPAP